MHPMDKRRRSGRLRFQTSASLPNRSFHNGTSTTETENTKGVAKRTIRNSLLGPRLTPGNAFAINSPVKKMNVQALFAQMIASWPSLSAEKQRRLVDVLPANFLAGHGLVGEDREAGDPMLDGEEKRIKCPISAVFVAEDDIIRRDVARFKRDVGDGYYRKKWQADGEKAMREREGGKFDAFIRDKAEKDFRGRGSFEEMNGNVCMDFNEAAPVVKENGFNARDIREDNKEEPKCDSMEQDGSSMEHKVLSSVKQG